MFQYIYNLLIILYKGLISCASLFHKKARLKIEGVKNSKNVVSYLDSTSIGRRILIHCSSQGEHEQALPIIRWILKHTDYQIVLSFFSPSGFLYAKHEGNSRIVKTYLPFDTRNGMSKFINTIQPQLVLIIKNEWWWNFLNVLRKRKIPTYLISATIRKEHYFIRYPIHYFLAGLSTFDSIFVIDDSSRNNISKVFKGRIIRAGDTRIDQANHSKNKTLQKDKADDNTLLSDMSHTIVYGSIWESDIDSINMLISLYPDSRHLIYPHDLSHANIQKISGQIEYSTIQPSTSQVIGKINIISAMGELKYAYGLASIAYIGGGFGVGIHNILEAAVYFIPTLFGPNYKKSNEAINLVSKKCSFSFRKANDLKRISKEINEEKKRFEIETKLKSYFSPEFSPTEIICQEIFKKSAMNV